MNTDTNNFILLHKAYQAIINQFPERKPEDTDTLNENSTSILLSVAKKLDKIYPFQHPLYMGHMIKPPTELAWLTYALTMSINPNNHDYESSQATTEMEKEAVAQIAGMVGWNKYTGHLCSGGTIANLEALWIGERHHPGEAIAASNQAHYTHERLSNVLNHSYVPIKSDERGKISLSDLEKKLRRHTIGTVVVTLGTTSTGALDPLPEILELKSHYGFRIHADACYGGFFRIAGSLTKEGENIFRCLPEVDSITIDPHKRGFQPYGCGCIIFKNTKLKDYYDHDAPYTYFESEDNLGEISLECSRSGASAAALWATLQEYPLIRGGQFAKSLDSSRAAALELYRKLKKSSHSLVAFEPELDIVIWTLKAENGALMSEFARSIYHKVKTHGLYFTLCDVPTHFFAKSYPDVDWNCEKVTCLRACLIKPEHKEWIPIMWDIYENAVAQNNKKYCKEKVL